jgi:hypothetical protein
VAITPKMTLSKLVDAIEAYISKRLNFVNRGLKEGEAVAQARITSYGAVAALLDPLILREVERRFMAAGWGEFVFEHNVTQPFGCVRLKTSEPLVDVGVVLATRILFLDIDGPMIPTRALFLQDGKLATVFDQVAVAMLTNVLDATKAKIVISSTFAVHGLERTRKLLTDNGVPLRHLHDDWTCRTPMASCREQEIHFWLARHIEVEKWAVLDDGALVIDNLVRVDNADGMMSRHHTELMERLK